MANSVQLDKLRRKGYDTDHPVKSEMVIKDGIEFEELTFADRDEAHKAGKINRALHGAGCILGSVLNVSSDFRKSTFGVASEGRKETKVLRGGTDPLDRERVAISVPIGANETLRAYNFNNSGELQRLLNNRGDALTLLAGATRDGNGNSYIPVDNKHFIFVPQGDMNKATLVPTRLTKLTVRLGYDPKDRPSIKAYLERPDIFRRLIVQNGNYYLPEEQRDGTSSFLFVPKGDFSKACSIKVSNSKTGEPLKGDAFDKMMFTYGKQYENMIKGMEKNAKERATRKAKKIGREDDQEWIQKEKKRILKSFRVAVMSPRGDHTRLYGRVDPNAKDIIGNRYYNSSMGGIRIDWDKPTAKEIKELWEKKPDSELKKERPFADSAPAATPPTQPMPPQSPHYGDHGLSRELRSQLPELDELDSTHRVPQEETLDSLPDLPDAEERRLMFQPPPTNFGEKWPTNLFSQHQ